MITLISCAKTMVSGTKVVAPFATTPTFYSNAQEIISKMGEYSADELAKILKISLPIAKENIIRYKNFRNKEIQIPAIVAYTGIVFKKIDPSSFTTEDFEFAQKHLRITSFAYGLLKPLDLINPYRLEGNITLPGASESLFNYWKPILTDNFIKDITESGGVLYNLASNEMKNLFDWKKIEKNVKVITPEFKTWHNGAMKTIVMHTKIARGETTREIIKNKIDSYTEIL